MTRILIFSPYALWEIHTLYEGVIAKECQTRGAHVQYLLCDGLLPECDQHWDSKANSSRPLDLCERCQTAARANLDNLLLPFRWLGDFANPAEKADAFAWAQGVPSGELFDARFRENPLGEWVLSSVISYFRQYPPDMLSSHVVSVYRGFLYSAAIVTIGLRNYLDANQIDSALLFNGRQSITRVAFEIFQKYGIRVLTHERAEYQRGHLNVKPNAHCMSPEPFKAFWNMWSQVPLRRESLEAALKWLIQRRYGANLAWIPFNTSFVHDSSLRTRMNLSQNKRLWALFTSSTDEIAGDPLMQGPYESQEVWVRDVVQWVGSRDDVELIIKVHPNLGGNRYIGKAIDELRIYREMKSTLPPNVRIVMPEDEVNAYSLVEEVDVGLTFGSTIGLEMAMLGKPVLLASRAIYEHSSRILTLRSRESLHGMLEKCLQVTTDKEIQRQAFRLAYYYIFAFERPFPKVKVADIYKAELNDKVRDGLGSESDSSLDHICNFLIENFSLFDAPAKEDQSRTTVEEDAFFEELALSRDYLSNARYDRWQRLKSIGRSTRKLLSVLPFGAGDVLLNLGRPTWHSLLTRVENGKLVLAERANSEVAKRRN
jgi:hypothetical protein